MSARQALPPSAPSPSQDSAVSLLVRLSELAQELHRHHLDERGSVTVPSVAQLSALRLSELRAQCQQAGVPEGQLDDAMDAESAKLAVAELLFRATAQTVPARTPAQAQRARPALVQAATVNLVRRPPRFGHPRGGRPLSPPPSSAARATARYLAVSIARVRAPPVSAPHSCAHAFTPDACLRPCRRSIQGPPRRHLGRVRARRGNDELYRHLSQVRRSLRRRR